MPTSWMVTVLRQSRRVGNFPYPQWAAVFLNNPVRRLIGRPGSVVEGLRLTGNERVLEIGPGPGYFSTELARRLPLGRLDVAICSAGLSMRAYFERSSLAAMERVVRVNFFGTLYVTHFALPHVVKTKGSLVAISSLTGKRGTHIALTLC